MQTHTSMCNNPFSIMATTTTVTSKQNRDEVIIASFSKNWHMQTFAVKRVVCVCENLFMQHTYAWINVSNYSYKVYISTHPLVLQTPAWLSGIPLHWQLTDLSQHEVWISLLPCNWHPVACQRLFFFCCSEHWCLILIPTIQITWWWLRRWFVFLNAEVYLYVFVCLRSETKSISQIDHSAVCNGCSIQH